MLDKHCDKTAVCSFNAEITHPPEPAQSRLKLTEQLSGGLQVSIHFLETRKKVRRCGEVLVFCIDEMPSFSRGTLSANLIRPVGCFSNRSLVLRFTCKDCSQCGFLAMSMIFPQGTAYCLIKKEGFSDMSNGGMSISSPSKYGMSTVEQSDQSDEDLHSDSR